jgi:hypothetical protein
MAIPVAFRSLLLALDGLVENRRTLKLVEVDPDTATCSNVMFGRFALRG